MRNKVNAGLAGIIALSGLVSIGCDNSNNNLPQRTSQIKQRVEYQILSKDSILTHDSVKEGSGEEFHVFKYNFEGNTGSYGLISNGKSNSYEMHWYIGNGVWKSVESKAKNDPFVFQLRNEMLQKLADGQISSESVPYNPK